MKRKLMQSLLAWHDSVNRKPLILRGARQVGKTWLMKEFGRIAFKQVVYINFDRDHEMAYIFDGSLEIPRLIAAIQIFGKCRITPQDTLIVLDEIQEAPRALASLKYFCEEAPEYAVIAAGSLLGVAMHKGTSFPVGKVDFLDLYPMSFTEFLDALGEEQLNDLLMSQDWQLISTFKDKFTELLRTYYFVGGMPEAVQDFATNRDFFQVRAIQQRILDAYEQDFSKHAPIELIARLRLVLQSIPAQLARENRRFVYGALRGGARAKDFELAIQWLKDCGLVEQVTRLSKPGLPPIAYATEGFKLFLLDVGLQGAMCQLPQEVLLKGNSLFSEFKGSLTEQYVAQQLRSELGLCPYYWSAERGTAEIDFLFHDTGLLYPVEVKAEENLKAKSLKVYSETFHPKCAIRCSLSTYRKQDWMLNLPLYAISQIAKECRDFEQASTLL